MGKIEGTQLGPDLLNLFDGSDLDSKVGETILLLTVNEAGWPHVAMLSIGELVAVQPGEVRIALWKDTGTSQNLRRTSKGTLTLVYGGVGHYVELEVTDSGPLQVGDTMLDRYTCNITRVLADTAGYATLTSGVRFDLPERESVVSRWERTVAAIRAL